MRRGAIQYCVLALLRAGPRYGFELVQLLGGRAGLSTGQGTIYPLLGRLRQLGHVRTEWKESSQGPPRRYYRLTDAGRRALEDFERSWDDFRSSVDAILAEGAGS